MLAHIAPCIIHPCSSAIHNRRILKNVHGNQSVSFLIGRNNSLTRKMKIGLILQFNRQVTLLNGCTICLSITYKLKEKKIVNLLLLFYYFVCQSASISMSMYGCTMRSISNIQHQLLNCVFISTI